MLAENSIAAASAPLETDLMAGLPERQSGRPRRLVAIALKGSAAAGDTKVAVMNGDRKLASLYNSGTGFPNRDDYKRIGSLIPANSEVSVLVTDAPVTNAINLSVDFEEL